MNSTQFDRLLADIVMLCGKLKRPVSSKDLLRYYRQFPDSRPLLLQRLGQVLFKMARVRSKTFSARIQKIGIIGNLAFYAPDYTEEMRSAFALYSTQVALAEQCRYRLPDYAVRLIGTRFEGMARNALAGFVEDWSPLVAQCNGFSSATLDEMHGLLATSRKYAASEFIRVVPENLISRADAAGILREEYQRRSHGTDTSTMNVGRHLVHLSWPQSRLFPPLPNLFWADQVKAYCASRWPVTSAEHELGRGLSLVMIYGPGE
jgi:hypothetical protein